MTDSTDGFDGKPRLRKPANRRSAAATLKLATIDGAPYQGSRKLRSVQGTEGKVRLTAKQEAFSQRVASGLTLSDAYRDTYDCRHSTPKSINEAASRLMGNAMIASRVDELKLKKAANTHHDPAQVKAEIIAMLRQVMDDVKAKPADRMRAGELLGKWGEVALFNEISTVKVEQASPETALATLQEKLDRMTGT